MDMISLILSLISLNLSELDVLNEFIVKINVSQNYFLLCRYLIYYLSCYLYLRCYLFIEIGFVTNPYSWKVVSRVYCFIPASGTGLSWKYSRFK